MHGQLVARLAKASNLTQALGGRHGNVTERIAILNVGHVHLNGRHQRMDRLESIHQRIAVMGVGAGFSTTGIFTPVLSASDTVPEMVDQRTFTVVLISMNLKPQASTIFHQLGNQTVVGLRSVHILVPDAVEIVVGPVDYFETTHQNHPPPHRAILHHATSHHRRYGGINAWLSHSIAQRCVHKTLGNSDNHGWRKGAPPLRQPEESELLIHILANVALDTRHAGNKRFIHRRGHVVLGALCHNGTVDNAHFRRAMLLRL